MITRKETARIRLEIEFDVLVGELQIVEQDLLRMTLSEFVEVYGPEKKDARMLIRMTNIGEVNVRPRDRDLLREAVKEKKAKASTDRKVQR